MATLTLKQKLVRCGAAVAAAGAIGSTMIATSPVNADPKQFSAFVGVGSDTTQDVLNAFAGFAGGTNFTPVQTTAATGQRQLISFDATGSDCIISRTGGGTFNRPNGSTGGRRALSRSLTGTTYGNALCGPAAGSNVSGQVQFARSSSGPAGGDVGTDLTYVPFGRDGVSFAYYRTDGSPVTTLTRAQLTSLFTTGTQTIDGVRIVPCGIQTASGTYGFWNTVTTATAAQENTATADCQALPGINRLQENDGEELKLLGDQADTAVNGTQVVTGFSAGAFIAKSNGVAAPTPPAGVGIGSISNDGNGNNLGSPIAGTAPNLTPSATFFANGTFGRTVFNVVPTALIGSAFGNADLKSMFSGPTSAVCQATATVQTFGFLPAPNCGVLNIRGSYIAGAL